MRLSQRTRRSLQEGKKFIKENLKWPTVLISLLGSTVLSFGLCHIHAYSHVTEGGVLGLTLLLDHHFHISPAFSGFVLNALCYILGWKYLGKSFLLYSAISSLNFSFTYKIFEQFDTVFPHLVQNPLLSAIAGALFVGIGAGLCVRAGGAPGGDDALAMAVSGMSGVPIQRVYLISDLSVLLLSLTYIPFEKIMYSLLTVLLSGQIIGIIQKWPNFPSSSVSADKDMIAD